MFSAPGLTTGYSHHPNSIARGISLKHCNLFNNCLLLVNIYVMKSQVLLVQILHVKFWLKIDLKTMASLSSGYTLPSNTVPSWSNFHKP